MTSATLMKSLLVKIQSLPLPNTIAPSAIKTRWDREGATGVGGRGGSNWGWGEGREQLGLVG